MVQDSGCLRLLLETPETVGIGGKGAGQNLDRDVPSQARVPRAVHLSHSSRANHGDDLVRAEAGSRGKRHGKAVRPTALAGAASRRSNVTIDAASPAIARATWRASAALKGMACMAKCSLS